MGLLGGLIKTAINVATIPLDMAGDVYDTAAERNQFGKSRTEKKIEKLGDNVDETLDGHIIDKKII